jgi:hypothetical protein
MPLNSNNGDHGLPPIKEKSYIIDHIYIYIYRHDSIFQSPHSIHIKKIVLIIIIIFIN